MVDSDVLIDIQRGHAPAVTWFTGLTELPSVCGLVIMELIQDAQNRKQVEDTLKLVAPLPVLWLSETDQSQALTYFTTRHLSHNLGLLDSLIAACALGHGATLYTFNKKHFSSVPGLVIKEPYPR